MATTLLSSGDETGWNFSISCSLYSFLFFSLFVWHKIRSHSIRSVPSCFLTLKSFLVGFILLFFFLAVVKFTTASVKAIAHWVQNFCTLKNKYDLTLCQSRLHTASETFVRHKKIGSVSIFCVFASIACILIGKDEEYEKTEKRTWKFRTRCAMTLKLQTNCKNESAMLARWVRQKSGRYSH